MVPGELIHLLASNCARRQGARALDEHCVALAIFVRQDVHELRPPLEGQRATHNFWNHRGSLCLCRLAACFLLSPEACLVYLLRGTDPCVDDVSACLCAPWSGLPFAFGSLDLGPRRVFFWCLLSFPLPLEAWTLDLGRAAWLSLVRITSSAALGLAMTGRITSPFPFCDTLPEPAWHPSQTHSATQHHT